MKEAIEQFKRELRSYKTYNKYINNLSNDLLAINNQLIGLKSPNLDGVPTRSGTDNRIELIEKKQEIESKLALYRSMVLLTESKLAKLEQVERDVLMLVYVEHVTIRKIGRTFYMSNASVFRWIDRIVRKAVG